MKTSKYIDLGFHFTEDLGLKAITFNHNDTHLPDDSKTLELIAIAMLKALHTNKQDMEIQDILNHFNISIGGE